MKHQQHLSTVKKILHVLDSELKYWQSAKELNLVKVYKDNGLPPTGFVASKLCDYLVNKDWIKFSKEGRYIRYKRTDATIDIDYLAEQFIYELNATDKTELKIDIKPRELQVKDSGFILNKDRITECVIIAMHQKVDVNSISGLNDIAGMEVQKMCNVIVVDGSILTVEHKLVFATMDELLKSIEVAKF